jgi:hypothetical protein
MCGVEKVVSHPGLVLSPRKQHAKIRPNQRQRADIVFFFPSIGHLVGVAPGPCQDGSMRVRVFFFFFFFSPSSGCATYPVRFWFSWFFLDRRWLQSPSHSSRCGSKTTNQGSFCRRRRRHPRRSYQRHLFWDPRRPNTFRDAVNRDVDSELTTSSLFFLTPKVSATPTLQSETAVSPDLFSLIRPPVVRGTECLSVCLVVGLLCGGFTALPSPYPTTIGHEGSGIVQAGEWGGGGGSYRDKRVWKGGPMEAELGWLLRSMTIFSSSIVVCRRRRPPPPPSGLRPPPQSVPRSPTSPLATPSSSPSPHAPPVPLASLTGRRRASNGRTGTLVASARVGSSLASRTTEGRTSGARSLDKGRWRVWRSSVRVR